MAATSARLKENRLVPRRGELFVEADHGLQVLHTRRTTTPNANGRVTHHARTRREAAPRLGSVCDVGPSSRVD